jgi:hypothetical protein
MIKRFKLIPIVSILFLMAISVNAQQPSTDKHDHHKHHSGKSDPQHHSEVNRRGDEAMGFSHRKTTHHFILKSGGGVIDVGANSASDNESRDQIRSHLKEIEKLFSEGDVTKPMHTHGKLPPGADVMIKLKAEIIYKYEETERGGRVLISTGNAEALRSVHEFLRFQIEDHKTGDPLEVQK